MTLPYSGAIFIQAFPRECTETFLEGHRRAFEFFGDTLGNLSAMSVTPANEQGRAQIGELAERVQEITEQSVKLAYVNPGYTGDSATSQTE